MFQPTVNIVDSKLLATPPADSGQLGADQEKAKAVETPPSVSVANLAEKPASTIGADALQEVEKTGQTAPPSVAGSNGLGLDALENYHRNRKQKEAEKLAATAEAARVAEVAANESQRRQKTWEIDWGLKISEPFTEKQIITMIVANEIAKKTPIRRSGSRDFEPADSFDEFDETLSQAVRMRHSAGDRSSEIK